MQVKRITALALAIAAAATPAASAMVPVEPVTGSAKQHGLEAPPGSAKQHGLEAPPGGSRFAEMAVLRDAIRDRQWQQAESAPVKALVRPEGDGLDWTSAAVGATGALALLLAGLLARPVVGRRRHRLAGVAS